MSTLTPYRTIVKRIGAYPRGKQNVVLECGHFQEADLRSKRMYCFDCYYKKPTAVDEKYFQQDQLDAWIAEQASECAKTAAINAKRLKRHSQ